MTSRYQTLENFLLANRLTHEGLLRLDYGGQTAANVVIKGRKIQAAILFVDIANFSGQTEDLDPLETVLFVNLFIDWMTALGIRDRACIVDKYIGDEIMVVFSDEFGSKDPFLDAVNAATDMASDDWLHFRPHFGVANGEVLVAATGTGPRFDVSVFGSPVTRAARCAGFESGSHAHYEVSFPADCWGTRSLHDLDFKSSDGWELTQPVEFDKAKNLRPFKVQQVRYDGELLQIADPRQIVQEAKASYEAGRRDVEVDER